MAFDWKKMKLSKDSKIRDELQGLLGNKGKVDKGKAKKTHGSNNWMSDFDEKIKKKNESLFG